MEILRVINTMHPSYGGPCQGIRNSIFELNKIDVKNEVVCLDDPLDSFIKADFFKIHALGKAKGPWSYNTKLVPWLISNFNRFDVVIIHGLWLYHSFAVIKAIEKFKKVNKSFPKIYVMPHGMLDPYFQKAEGRKIKALRNLFYWNIIEKKVIQKADAILFTCEEELKLARQTFKHYSPNEEINVGYGIKTPPLFEKFMFVEFKEKFKGLKTKNYLLFLSRIHEKKGIDLLIQGYIKLKKDGLLMPQLVIAGPGQDSAFGMQLKHLASQDKDIIFTGMLTGNLKWGAFYGCQAFILPSHQENFGIAVVEALACRKPVLITDQVNIWREIKDNNAGLISADSARGVENMLKDWINLDANSKEIISKNALSLYENTFTAANAAKLLIKVLNK